MSERNTFVTSPIRDPDQLLRLRHLLNEWAWAEPLGTLALYGICRNGSEGRMVDEEFDKLGGILCRAEYAQPFRLAVAGDSLADCVIYTWTGKKLHLHTPNWVGACLTYPF